MINHVLYVNDVTGQGMSEEFLEGSGGKREEEIHKALIEEAEDQWYKYYSPEKDHVYGALPWVNERKSTKEWLKRMATLIKEPAYTSYTNIKLAVDYIFY